MRRFTVISDTDSKIPGRQHPGIKHLLEGTNHPEKLVIRHPFARF
jgi:hypothetical protein